LERLTATEQAKAAGVRPGDPAWIWDSDYDWSVEGVIAKAEKESGICRTDVREIYSRTIWICRDDAPIVSTASGLRSYVVFPRKGFGDLLLPQKI
jgi:hypothetical protein